MEMHGGSALRTRGAGNSIGKKDCNSQLGWKRPRRQCLLENRNDTHRSPETMSACTGPAQVQDTWHPRNGWKVDTALIPNQSYLQFDNFSQTK